MASNITYLITGANRGIGLAIVKALASQPGNLVIGTARNASSANDLTAIPGVKVVLLDLDDAKTIRAAAGEISQITGGSLDVLVNQAAFASLEARGDIESFPSDEALIANLTGYFRTNTIGTILVTNALLPLLEKGTKKTVVNISTPLASQNFIRKSKYNKLIGYALSKAGVNYMNTQYATKHEAEGFTFIALSPGWLSASATVPPTVLTPEQIAFVADMVAHYKAAAPNWNGQSQTPEESAKRLVPIIQSLTPKDNGKFLSHHRDEETWF